jgi:hypothetical protein
VEQAVADVLFEEAAALLDDDHLVAVGGELADDLHVRRVAHAHLEDREHAGEAEVGQDVLQVRAGHAGDDEAEGGKC